MTWREFRSRWWAVLLASAAWTLAIWTVGFTSCWGVLASLLCGGVIGYHWPRADTREQNEHFPINPRARALPDLPAPNTPPPNPAPRPALDRHDIECMHTTCPRCVAKFGG